MTGRMCLISPVNLDESESERVTIGNFQIQDLFDETAVSTMANNRETVKVRLLQDCYLTGGPFKGRYKFQQMHFHWGTDDDNGSEHLFRKKRFAAEGHLVFTFDYKYKAPLEVLEAANKLNELEYKIRYLKVEKKEDDNENRKEEDEELEELKQKFARDEKNLEFLEKKIAKEWDKFRLQIIAGMKNKEIKKVSHEVAQTSEESKKKFRFLRLTNRRKEKPKQSDDKPQWEEAWNEFKQQSTNLLEVPSVELTENTKDGTIVNLNPGDSENLLPQKEITSNEAVLTLETDAMNCMEKNALEESKTKYIEWKKSEIKNDKILEKKIKEKFEGFDRVLKQRKQLGGQDKIPEEQKKLLTLRWTIEDNKRENDINDTMKEAINRKKKELDDICTSDIHCISVIGILFEVRESSPAYDLFNYVLKIVEPDSVIRVERNLFLQLKYGLSTGQYFVYNGTFTAPQEKSENVNWIVMKDPLPIRSVELRLLKSIKSENGPIGQNCNDTVHNVGKQEIYYNQCLPVQSQTT